MVELGIEDWGSVALDMGDIRMMLAKAYQIEPRSAAAAKAYAKLSYMILVGEDEIFKATHHHLVSPPVRPAFSSLVREFVA